MTDKGLVRQRNEDTLLLHDLEHNRGLPEAGEQEHVMGRKGVLLAVLDGMGGAASGDVASRLGADVIREKMTQLAPTTLCEMAEALGQVSMDAHREIRARAARDDECEGMGTTLLGAAVVAGALVYVHVGDSRAYLVRRGKLYLLTEDQSLFQELYTAGDLSDKEAEEGLHSNVILQALGVNDRIFPCVFQLPLRGDDLLLICSDGLTDLVAFDRLEELANTHADDLPQLAKTLVAQANARGGYDNISVVLAQFSGEALPAVHDDPTEDIVEPRPMSVSSIPSPGRVALRDYTLLFLVLLVMAVLSALMVWAGG
ncbi:MAG: serine/threonine-protein phosphatase [Deltaproteobacteria bacterium]|nr:serine/threonine-protein phosphatase [Deltaproteobacteria bacterium]